MLPTTFRCYYLERDPQGRVAGHITERPLRELPEGDVLIRVAYSSLNYKDALAASGHPGVNRVFPHVPGVDAAGWVVESGSYDFIAGEPVLVTGYDMGANRWGGFAEYVRVPHAWVVALPEGLSLRESMTLGTAGFTAALCVHALQLHDITPKQGEIAVSGASGGVGSIAVSLLAKLGYQVVAITGKAVAHDYLRTLGAAEIAGRELLDNPGGKPLLSGRWAGAVDTVGGQALATLLATTRQGGCVAACGMVGGSDLHTTVYPFILRGVTLAGIDAVSCPMPLRRQIWAWLGSAGKPDQLHQVGYLIDWEKLPANLDALLAGRMLGRTVLRVGPETPPSYPADSPNP